MKTRTWTAVVTLAALVALAPPCPAQDETPPEEDLPLLGRAAPTSTAAPQSLADVARRIKLRQPPDEGAIVISNSNLHQVGKQGWLSVTGTATAPNVGSGSAQAAGQARQAWEEGYNQQSETIDRLESRLRDYDTAMAVVPDPYRQGRSPHSYAGGRRPAISIERDQLEAQLELERSKLDRMRQQGRRLGVSRDWYDQEHGAEQQ